MATNSSNSTTESPMSVGMTTNGLGQVPARFSQKFITGKVIRLQAHVYVFVCSHCDAEFRSPNSFLQHCELHYSMSIPTQMPYFPPNYPSSSSFPEQIPSPFNRIPTGVGSATMPSMTPFNSYNNSSAYFQSRRWPQFNTMAYNNNQPSSIAPRQANSSSWLDCCSPIGGAQAQSSRSAMQNSVVNQEQQMPPTEEQSDLFGMGTVHATDVPDDDIYEIYDLGYDVSSAVADPSEPKRKKRSKSKAGPYICEFCSKPYDRLASLTRHYHSKHKQTPPKEARPASTA